MSSESEDIATESNFIADNEIFRNHDDITFSEDDLFKEYDEEQQTSLIDINEPDEEDETGGYLIDNEIFRNHDDITFSEDDLFKEYDEEQQTSLIDINEPDEEDEIGGYLIGDNIDSEDDFSSTEVKSPGGSKTVIWIPKVAENVEPKKDQEFDTLDLGIQFYEDYAKKAGFDVRKGSVKKKKNIIRYKYAICSRAGEPDKSKVDTLNDGKVKNKRKRPSKMISCAAKIGFKIIDGTERYFVKTFEKMHNHPLYTKDTVHMSRHRRQLNFFDKTLIQQLNASNVGATKAHAIVTGMKGGYKKQGPKKIDYKNYSRDLNCLVGNSDANFLINLLRSRKKNVPSFSFYHLLEDNELRAVFWADGIAKRNYKEFSDVVAFDATFKTNKYNMVFVPFTGIDNHKRCVTFGAGLLAKETAEYYTWLLKSFISSFVQHPTIVVTDQDPAMAIAVAKVFTKSTHRLCMWHIGKKLTDKVAAKIIYETDFRKRLQRLIWNQCIDPNTFEERWAYLIAKFKLQDNKWLKEMYAIRERWIPAYFKDKPLTGLMRTTSRSESENYFFQSFMSKKANLLMFMFKFDAAMDKQRNIQSTSEYDSISKKPALETILPFEAQASKFYTNKIFDVFKKEVHDCVWSCSPGPVISLDSYESCIVLEQKLTEPGQNKSLFFFTSPDVKRRENEYQVRVYANEDRFECSCMVFEHYGILCRHILCIMKKRFMKEIPEKYLLRRWQKGIFRLDELNKTFSIGDNTSSSQKKVQEAYSIFCDCINIVGHDEEAMAQFIQSQKDIRSKIQANPPKADTRSRTERLEEAIGVSKSDNITIRNPKNIRNKGRGKSSKRLKGKREIALKAAEKDGRFCTFCEKKIAPSEKHDRRNCPLRKAMEKDQTSQSTSESDESD